MSNNKYHAVFCFKNIVLDALLQRAGAAPKICICTFLKFPSGYTGQVLREPVHKNTDVFRQNFWYLEMARVHVYIMMQTQVKQFGRSLSW